MNFDYNSYINDGLIIPCLIIVFVGLILSIPVCFFIKNKQFEKLIFPLLAFAFVLLKTVPTITHTIILPFEGRNNSVKVTGTVDHVNRSIISHRFMVDDSYTDSVIVSIDGEKVLFMSGDGLYAGREIRLEYLPKSRIALSWEYIDGQEIENKGAASNESP